MARIDVAAIRTKEILDAAYKVFSEKGYHDAGIADIAAELQIGHGTIYRYFKNKADIAWSVPFGSNLTSLTPTYTTSSGAT